MCRLALMNRAAVQRLGTSLAALFADLELSMGGHGNGVAGLWSGTGVVNIRKGLALTAAQAAAIALAATSRGADWILFHTRLATSGGRASRHCHPFKSGQLVLAHNGHSFVWDQLGSSLGISDSECITQIWSRLRLPLTTLEEVDGVFLGFRSGEPFVVKGSADDDLTVSVHKETRAILFASELDWSLRYLFDQTVEAGRLLWFGEKLDIKKIKPRQRVTTKYTTTSSLIIKPRKVNANQASAGRADEGELSSSITLSDLREWYQRTGQEEGSEPQNAVPDPDLSAATTLLEDE